MPENSERYNPQHHELSDVTSAPTFDFKYGRAWRIDADRWMRARGVPRNKHSTVALWMCEAPWANLAWHSYWFVLLHLRPMPTLNGAVTFYLPGATHELWVIAMNPAANREKVLAGEVAQADFYLQPFNFASQFIEIEDALAIDRVNKAIGEVCKGELSPDTDFREMWMDRFGDNMVKPEFKR